MPAAPALDDLAGIWADLCLLCDRHASRLLIGRVSHLPDLLLVDRDPSDADGHGNIGYVPMAITGYLEQAKLAAQRTFIPGSESAGSGQDDVASPVFLAYAKEATAGRCLDAALAMLAVMASQALHVTKREAPPALSDFVKDLRARWRRSRPTACWGRNSTGFANSFTARVFSGGGFLMRQGAGVGCTASSRRLEARTSCCGSANPSIPASRVSTFLEGARTAKRCCSEFLEGFRLPSSSANVLNSESRFADGLRV